MRRFSVLVLIFTFFAGSFEATKAGPIVVGGGAGGSEFAVVFARANLETMLSDCLRATCGLTADEAQAFEPLLDRTKSIPLAVFKTSAELSGNLYEVRPSEVWFNRELLWLDAGKTIPFDVDDASKLWLEILNLDGVVSKPDLLLLQTRLARTLDIEKSEQAYDTENTFQILLWKTSPQMDRLYVSSSPADTFELTEAVIATLACSDLRSFKIQSPTWISAAPIPPTGKPETIILKLSLNVNWVCGTRSHAGFGSAIVRVTKNTSDILAFDPQSLEINMGEL